MAKPMHVAVVSPEGQIWSGESSGVSVRTVEGSLGILSDHEPVLTILAPGAAEIITLDGRREVIAVSGGFMTVNDNLVTILTDSAIMGQEISLEAARRELAELEVLRDEGDNDDENEHRYNQALSQIRAAEKFRALQQ
jgi:F-type H+-transporting ATPase subunit epsilon